MYIFCFTISFFFTQCYLFLLLKCIHFLALFASLGRPPICRSTKIFMTSLQNSVWVADWLTFIILCYFCECFITSYPFFDKIIDRYIQKVHLVVKYFQMIYYKFVKKKKPPWSVSCGHRSGHMYVLYWTDVSSHSENEIYWLIFCTSPPPHDWVWQAAVFCF